MRRSVWRVGVASLCAVTVSACGLPKDVRARRIDGRDIPSLLAVATTTTTTTTTTTIPSTTTTTSTTLPAPPPSSTTTTTPTTTTSTTLPPAPMESLSLYFPHGDRLGRVVSAVPLGTTLQQVIVLLAAGPGTLGPPDARTAIELGDVVSVQLTAGVLSVELAPKFRDLPATEQRLAVAQLVLTLTERPGVGQVVFTIARRPVAVPRANGSFGSRTVSSDDYVDLVDEPPTTTNPDEATTVA